MKHDEDKITSKQIYKLKLKHETDLKIWKWNMILKAESVDKFRG